MRELGTLPDAALAERFQQYLRASEIPAAVEAEDGEFVLWIEEEDHLEKARDELNRFRANPNDPVYLKAAEIAQRAERDEEKRIKAIRRRQVNLRKRWSGHWYAAWPATMVLMVLSVGVVFAFTDWGDFRFEGLMGPSLCDRPGSLISYLYFDHVDIIKRGDGVKLSQFRVANIAISILQHGQIWRLVTPIFIHFSLLHILFNMMWLKQLGAAIEFKRGTLRFLLIVLTIAVVSNTAQYIWSGPTFGGMSGVVFGLAGYIWMKGKYEPELGLGLLPNMVVWLIFWLIICMTGAVGNIANAAHLVGLATGMAIAVARPVTRQLIGRLRE